MTHRIKPLKEHVAVKPIDAPNVTKGGIQLPGNQGMSNGALEGLVVAIGPDQKDVKVGDHVFFTKFAIHSELMLDDEKFYVVRDQDLLAIIQEKSRIAM